MNDKKLTKASDLDIHYGDKGPSDIRYQSEHPCDFIDDAIDRRMVLVTGGGSSISTRNSTTTTGAFPGHRAGCKGMFGIDSLTMSEIGKKPHSL